MGLDTVDGTNPAAVNMVNIPLFTRFYTSQVVQDRSHLAPGQVELLREALKARVYAVSSVNGFQSQDRPSH